MFCCFQLGFSKNKKRKGSSPAGEKKRRDRPTEKTLHGDGISVVAEVREKPKSKEAPPQRRLKETETTRSPRREREAHRARPKDQYYDAHNPEEHDRSALHLDTPGMWYRSVDPESSTSSQEMLLNPRPHRSTNQRQRHPKRTSQTTLRGRGTKRDPPKHRKSKKDLQQQSSWPGWSLFSPSPPKTPKRERQYQTLDSSPVTFDSSPRSHRSTRHRQSSQPSQQIPETSQLQQRHTRSRQHARQPSPARVTRSRASNTTARRTPDRRFAVLAATNQALESVRREAFAHPSPSPPPPPPRRERTQRYQGVTIPTSSIPFNWDCVSSSQNSAGHTETSSRHRRSRR
jgi:hypothetical protein